MTGLRDFGAFVNLGGADGLIHVSELAWHRVDHPRDVLRVGEEIDVYVLSLDRESNRIALSRKRLLADPWDKALENYYEGMLVEGTVTNVVDFGAFIALDDGLEGLLHLSEMGDGSLKEPLQLRQEGRPPATAHQPPGTRSAARGLHPALGRGSGRTRRKRTGRSSGPGG